MKSFGFILFLLGLASVNAQTILVRCSFTTINTLYTCQIAGVTVEDNLIVNIIFGGNHHSGRTNSDVNRAEIIMSNIPFVLSQLFVTFPNLVELKITNGGLTRIQTGAFANAINLKTIAITGNSNLRTLESNAFSGAINANFIDMFLNQISEIHEQAFEGLHSLGFLHLDNNRIAEIRGDTFQNLSSLDTLVISGNSLSSLPGRLFANTAQIRQIEMANNEINAIGRNFVDWNLTNLKVLNLVGNRCTSGSWIIQDNSTFDIIRQSLSTCFDNSNETTEPPIDNEVRRFILELHGTLIIRAENGTEIARL